MISAHSPTSEPHPPVGRAPPPIVELEHLDTLWFQVTGMVCNLWCTHCFISCSPENHELEFLSLEEVRRWLTRSVEWGVREYYFTGGEPFMHERLPEMLEAALRLGPATVLTNGTLLRKGVLERLRRVAADSRYSLEIRVSVDGPSAERNDPIRGEGTFERVMEGIRRLLDSDFLPIVTATRTWPDERSEEVRRDFVSALQEVGYEHPRLKILPSLRIGRERLRSRGYQDGERVSAEMLEGFDTSQLLCSHGRVVTSRGVHVCPILLDSPDSRLGASLEEADRPFSLRHQACHTCWLHGAICTNFGGVGEDVG